MASVLSKFVRGAATFGAGALAKMGEAQIIAQRDAVLQGYAQQNMAATQKFQSGERVASQQFAGAENQATRDAAANENTLNRNQRADEFAVTSNLQQQGVDNQGRSLDMQGQQLTATLAAAEQALASGKLQLEQAEQVQMLMDVATDPNADPASRESAIDSLDVLRGDGGNNYESFTVYGPENEFGVQTRGTGILDRRRGTRQMIGADESAGAPASPAGGAARPQTEAEYNALPSGTMFIDPDDGQTYIKP